MEPDWGPPPLPPHLPAGRAAPSPHWLFRPTAPASAAARTPNRCSGLSLRRIAPPPGPPTPRARPRPRGGPEPLDPAR